MTRATKKRIFCKPCRSDGHFSSCISLILLVSIYVLGGPKTSSSSRSQLGTASNVSALSIPYDERRYKAEVSSSDDIEAKGSLVSKNSKNFQKS